MKKNKQSVFKFSLFGSRAEVHNQFISDSLDFDTTINKIKSLVKAGDKEKIIINIDVFISNNPDNSNYYRLHDIIRIILNFGIKRVQFNLINPDDNKLIDSLDIVASYISKARYVFLFDLIVKVKGLPYCLIPEPESLIIKSSNKNDFVKLKRCKLCSYNQKCDGILKGYLKKQIFD